MDLEIENIRVTVEGLDMDKDKIAGDIQSHLEKALEDLSSQTWPWEESEMEIKALELPEIDWVSESDKTETLTRLILNELLAAGLNHARP